MRSTPKVVDVAKRAQVSTATVSRVLNRPDSVRPELRARVQKVIEEIGYVPNAGARALSLNRSGNIGALIPTIDNAIFAAGVQAFQQRVTSRGYQLLLATSEYDLQTELEQVMNLVSRGVEALAMFGRSQKPELLQFLAQRRLPFVHVGVDRAPRGGVSIGFNNQQVMQPMVQYLVGENLPAQRVIERPYQIESAREGMRQLMMLRPRPTAVICGNDVLALGALIECQRLGIRVPQDVSVAGFDDLEISRHFCPSLTTMHVPTEQMWQRAADYLIGQIEADPVEVGREIEVSLIVRESTGPASGASLSRRA
jgi:LacI family transcriptional regulator